MIPLPPDGQLARGTQAHVPDPANTEGAAGRRRYGEARHDDVFGVDLVCEAAVGLAEEEVAQVLATRFISHTRGMKVPRRQHMYFDYKRLVLIKWRDCIACGVAGTVASSSARTSG
jgi:hypothetical protein